MSRRKTTLAVSGLWSNVFADIGGALRGGSPAWGVVENAEGGWNEGGVPPTIGIDFRVNLTVGSLSSTGSTDEN